MLTTGEKSSSKAKVLNVRGKSNNGRIPLTENALQVLERRCLIKDDKGQPIETSEKMFRRIAANIAKADALFDKNADLKAVEDEFYGIMTNLDFMPNSPTLMNAGRRLQQLSACFVLPVDDNMESIFQAIKDTAIIHKSGGGTGFSFSTLRPKDDLVSTTYGLSSGPISFMQVFDAATHAVNQGGFRRGANMGIMNVEHPDIEEFISCKKDRTKLTNFNISVGLTENFMQKVIDNVDFQTINPRSGKPVKKLKAREIFEKIVYNAWESGEPGIVFLDRINVDNPTPHIGRIESTNPCGEQPLLPYEACNLGSISLSNFVKDGKVDFKRLREVVRSSVHFLDNVVDLSEFPIERIGKIVLSNRKIGLGVMGWADMLLKLRIPYNSEEAISKAEEVMGFIQNESHRMSQDLAKSRGEFSNFKGSIYDKPGAPPMRNATVTTIAPTGTISIIAGCSSGVEPLFAVCFIRNVMDNTKLMETNPIFEQIAKEEGFYSEELMEKIASEGSVANIDEVPDRIKRIFVTAHDITPEWHVRMQAAFQKNIDNAVSKTVNFPKNATQKDVSDVFKLAWKLGCKGVTIYRDGCRDMQVLTRGGKTEEEQEDGSGKAKVRGRKKRPKILEGKTVHMETGCGSLYVTVNRDKDGCFELFTTMGKAGGCAASQNEAIGRLVSLAWRSGIPAKAIVKQLIGISCQNPKGLGKGRITSCADAVAKAIQMYIDPEAKDGFDTPNFLRGACPICGGVVEHEGGCFVCRACGYSDCA